ncbi:uncharacterized protein METZ01_LOCUS394717 [marine metagenome]|uniref:Uncharacterized protein n=1 Tax=marine metagenome TaxID=408172 RepID=A0A382V5U6_9ZZZZ
MESTILIISWINPSKSPSFAFGSDALEIVCIVSEISELICSNISGSSYA